MPEAWSLEEVEATIADYFNMLDKELRGLDYNKTEHRHRLAATLNHRSEGAIERKHQNISAVLIELGFPYISGYKPLRNYQNLLFDIVSDRLENRRDLINLVKHQVIQPSLIPEIDDILAAWVDPPTAAFSEINKIAAGVRERAPRFNVDYIAQEAKNLSLGVAGEEFVLRFEKARLVHAGQENLASKIEHTALKSDNAGYDILSFETTGQERLIEVKTTAYGPLTPFFVTSNELTVSHRKPAGYHLYRTYNFRQQPKLFSKQGPLDHSFKLDPTQYMANIA